MTRDEEKIEQDRGTHTPARLRHPALDPMASYVSAFGTHALKRVEEDLHHFYRTEDFPRLEERVEFSLSLGDATLPNLRYGLFRLFEPDLIAEYFHKHGFPRDEARQVMDIIGPVTPEFAVANDFSPGRERLKLYSMRLDSVRDRTPEIISAVEELSAKMGLPIELPPAASLEDITLVSVDFHPGSSRRELKIYTILQPERDLVAGTLAGLSISSPFLSELMDIMKEHPGGHFQALIQCFRFTSIAQGLSGYSLFAIIEPGFWPSVEDLLKRSAPEQLTQVREHFDRVESRGWRTSVRHIGSSFTLPEKLENFHLYFSVV